MLTVLVGIAEFERKLIKERTSTGRITALKCGVRFGRPSRLTADQMVPARRLLGNHLPGDRIRGEPSGHGSSLIRQAIHSAGFFVTMRIVTQS